MAQHHDRLISHMKARKAHSLTGIITIDLMHKASEAVRKNREAAGIDKMFISMFE